MAFPDLDDARFRDNVSRFAKLIAEAGPRPLAEFLAELGADTLRMTDIEQRLERYARLDPDKVCALGGDCFPPRPGLRLVGGRRHG